VAEPMLDVDQVDVGYAGGAHALRGVSLTIDEGERVGIIGPNGAGKTTIARTVTCMTRAYRATVQHGSVTFKGRDVTGWPAHRALREGIVTIPEGRGVIPNMTVEDNLRLVLVGLPRNRRGALSEAWSMYPVLQERRGSMAGLLSGGEQQMLAVARALIARPQLIVADELSLGLAPRIVKEILDGLSVRAAGEGTAVLLIEQAAVLSLKFVDRAYVLDQGRTVAAGTSEELGSSGEMTAKFLGVGDLTGTEELL
jgi:branched-chain amino acid transport system ATP-binding protein